MIIVVDVTKEDEKCRSCRSQMDLIEIQALDSTVYISDRVILCKECKKTLVDRLISF